MTRTAGETIALGRSFSATLEPGAVVGLVGPLGSGKTQFVKGICSGLNVREEALSPSFVLMHRYEGRRADGTTIMISHYDFYRLTRPEELDEIGFRETAGGDGITLVEWADAFEHVMPEHTQTVTFAHGEDPDTRTVRMPHVPASRS